MNEFEKNTGGENTENNDELEMQGTVKQNSDNTSEELSEYAASGNFEKLETDAEKIGMADNSADNEVIALENNNLPAEEKVVAPTIHRWNYEEQKSFTEKSKKRYGGNSALIYALIISVAFILCFALLVGLLLGNMSSVLTNAGNTSAPSTGGMVYVRDNTNGEGAMPTQQIYSTVLPSVVSLSVNDGTVGAVGTGFIISDDGYIVTANHVVEGMTRITAIMSDGTTYEAIKIDGNAFTDIALIKIEASGLPTVKLGKSSDMLVGDKVFAIGCPVSTSFSGSMTEGLLSYKDRVLDIQNAETGAVEKKMTLIQTDALLNPGNSGCPLLNAYGEVVGIVTMKLNSNYYEAICFAIPIDAAMPIVNAMKSGEDYTSLLSAVSRYPAKLGITAKTYQSSDNSLLGVEIMEFTDGTYDISRKMQVGDIIVKIDSHKITSIQDVSMVLNNYSIGDTVKITFYRNSQLMSVYVQLGK